MPSAFMTQPVWLEQGRKKPSAEMKSEREMGPSRKEPSHPGKKLGLTPRRKVS